MAKADKRARKRENQQKARAARAAAIKRSKRNRNVKRGAIASVAVLALVGVLYGTRKDNNDKTAATTTTELPTTTTPIPTTTVALPAGCVDTVPKKQGNGKQYKKVGDAHIDPTKTYTATFETTCGTFVASLDAKNSPKGVNNFVFLARDGFYDGLTWHRVVNNFVIQGGDPTASGSGGPGYKVVTELPKDGYHTGDLAWAIAGGEPDGEAGSQFFVTTGSPDSLTQAPGESGEKYRYGYFGKVISGLDNAKKLEAMYPQGGDGPPTHPLYILKVTITEK